PLSAPALLRIASIQLDEHHPDQALALLDQAVELVPEDSDAHVLRGRAHLALNHTAAAIDDLDFAVSRTPERADAHFHLAVALTAAHKQSAARVAADTAAKLAPEWAEARDLSEKLRR